MTRKLLSTRRTVAASTPQYLSAWEALCALVEEQGGHAWLFRSETHPHLFNEFIEWKQADGAPVLTALPRLVELRRALEPFGPSEEDSWTQP